MNTDDAPEVWQKRLDEIRASVERLEQASPARVDSGSLLTRARIPYKVLSYRGASTWRFAELRVEGFQ